MAGIPRARTLAAAGGAAFAGGALWARKHPSACPYALRWLLKAPRPFLGVSQLMEILEPAPGERLLEVGPGIGFHSLPVAERLSPEGRLDLLDVQREMLDELMERARERGLDNLVPVVGDARELPYEDRTFDGAYLVTVLGEVPDQARALEELRRVLKPGGRLVVGETPPLDPHFVTLGALRSRADTAGLRFERLSGHPALGYFARFVTPP